MTQRLCVTLLSVFACGGAALAAQHDARTKAEKSADEIQKDIRFLGMRVKSEIRTHGGGLGLGLSMGGEPVIASTSGETINEIVITDVPSGSWGDTQGVRVRERLDEIDGHRVRTRGQLLDALRQLADTCKPGDTFVVRTSIGDSPEGMRTHNVTLTKELWLEIEASAEKLEGGVTVYPDSELAKAGLPAGSVITWVDDQRIEPWWWWFIGGVWKVKWILADKKPGDEVKVVFLTSEGRLNQRRLRLGLDETWGLQKVDGVNKTIRGIGD